jgi:4-hydroxybenzoate-CoA ligase/benzoate-CoA ligase
VSAGEALPEDIGRRWQERFGVPVLDGVGSSEMLHIFLSNRHDDVRYGTSGVPVPGYALKLIDDAGSPVPGGELGELAVSGDSSAEAYWNQTAKSRRTFVGEWTLTGDKYYVDDAGYYHFCGRTDDMFKSGGNWVSPFDVEAALITHPKVLEAAVVAHPDAHGNLKPKAFVVLRNAEEATDELAVALQAHVKQHLELWKYPRWIEFRRELPKTATGTIQRFKLRDA